MIWILDTILFLCVFSASLCFVGWMDARGIREIRLYSDEFLMAQEKAVKCRVLPDPASRRLSDRLELALYYSGIRGRYPFVSVKFWVLFQCFAALWVWILVSAGRGFGAAFLCACGGAGLLRGGFEPDEDKEVQKNGGALAGGD